MMELAPSPTTVGKCFSVIEKIRPWDCPRIAIVEDAELQSRDIFLHDRIANRRLQV